MCTVLATLIRCRVIKRNGAVPDLRSLLTVETDPIKYNKSEMAVIALGTIM